MTFLFASVVVVVVVLFLGHDHVTIFLLLGICRAFFSLNFFLWILAVYKIASVQCASRSHFEHERRAQRMEKSEEKEKSQFSVQRKAKPWLCGELSSEHPYTCQRPAQHGANHKS